MIHLGVTHRRPLASRFVFPPIVCSGRVRPSEQAVPGYCSDLQ